MNIQNKKILITGGGSGIGFAIAKAFSEKGNQIILAGRNEEKLEKASLSLKNTSYIVCDVSDDRDVKNLVKQINENFRGIDILVNNAGVAKPQPLISPDGIYENAKYEMEINYLSVLRLTERLLPFLKASHEAAIINIQSIVSYSPNSNIATYSATKAALHSYSQSLRLVLQKTNPHIKVFEVFPPFVDTDLTKGLETEKMSPTEVAQDILASVSKDEYAIRNGKTKNIYQLFLQSPEDALNKINGIA